MLLAVLADLRDRLLVTDEGLRLIGMVRQYLPVPLGLGRPMLAMHQETPLYELQRILSYYGSATPRAKAAARELLADLLGDAPALAEMMARLPAEFLEVLRRYDAEGPVLREPGLNVWDGRPPTDPVAHELILAGLLVPTHSGTLELPQEVGLALRYPAVTRFPFDAPPSGRPVEVHDVAAPAAAAVSELLGQCDAVLDRIAGAPIPLLTSGGVGVKDLRALGKELTTAPETVSSVLSLLRGVGALAATTKDLRVTSAERARSALPDGRRWTELVQAWLALSDLPPSPRRLSAALSWTGYDGRVHVLRGRLLQRLEASSGRSSSPEQWLVRWQARWPEQRRTAADRAGMVPERDLRTDVLEEAARCGVLVDGAPSPLLAVLLSGADLDAALAEAAGAGETRVRAQTDGTLVCTGRPARDMKFALDRIATVESAAQATVWRLSEASLTRAYDEGDAPERVLEVLDRYAGSVPQAMAYLVRDAHRRHGRARVGTATAFVVVEDDVVLATALASKGAAGTALAKLAVRRVAPGVAVSKGSVEATVVALRSAGVPAVAESAIGRTQRRATPAGRRAPAPEPRLAPLPAPDDPSRVDEDVDRLLGAAAG